MYVMKTNRRPKVVNPARNYAVFFALKSAKFLIAFALKNRKTCVQCVVMFRLKRVKKIT